jgi:GcrA cell cycle regulator
MEPLMVKLLELEAHNCRWPCGDPHDDGFGFCGHDRQPGSSYCPHHEALSRSRVPMRLRIIPTPQRRVAA